MMSFVTQIVVDAGFSQTLLQESSWYTKLVQGAELLADVFSGDVKFCVVSPPYTTLREQTHDRLVQAKLLQEDDDHILTYAKCSRKHKVRTSHSDSTDVQL